MPWPIIPLGGGELVVWAKASAAADAKVSAALSVKPFIGPYSKGGANAAYTPATTDQLGDLRKLCFGSDFRP